MKRFFSSKLVSDYGSFFILLLLCSYYSAVTVSEQHPITPSAGRDLARTIIRERGADVGVMIVVRDTQQDRRFAEAIEQVLRSGGAKILKSVAGTPMAARTALDQIGSGETKLGAIATNHPASQWGPLREEKLTELARHAPALRETKVYKPPSYLWPSFLRPDNLLNIANQIAVIAIIAIGMTMVIITAGIDLSVGSLLALSAVLTAVAVQSWAGGKDAGTLALIGCALIGIGTCACCGVFNGVMVTRFRVPPFVVTLGMMMIARGLALIIAVRYQSLTSGGTEGTPEAVAIRAEAFGWLGNGQLFGIPNPILLMLALYILAHLMMTRTTLGRYIYAVGGNPRAARLSGVSVSWVLVIVYAICAAMAGLGGVVDASRFEGGRPNGGELYELQVIAAVVVGGTSLAGGEGRIFGTLIGALIIAVIQNGLNLAHVKSYEQKVVFGVLILAAVLLDRLKKRK